MTLVNVLVTGTALCSISNHWVKHCSRKAQRMMNYELLDKKTKIRIQLAEADYNPDSSSS